MRKIKFRAWDKRGEKMYQVQDLGIGKENWLKTATNYKEQPDTGYNKFYPSEVEIMQYTGLKDKNGKEIYEGDIVNIETMEGEKETAKIEYSEDYAQYIITSTGIVYLEAEPLCDFIDRGIEVIGNVWDNPELLKGEEKENE